jgi:hypothetical protein
LGGTQYVDAKNSPIDLPKGTTKLHINTISEVTNTLSSIILNTLVEASKLPAKELAVMKRMNRKDD